MQVDTNVSESDVGRAARVSRRRSPSTRIRACRSTASSPGPERPITVQNVVTYDVVIAVDNPKSSSSPA
jgi:hypothetical protein